MKKLIFFLFFVLILFGIAGYKFYPQLEVATGYAAKIACSNYFQGRELEEIKEIDLAEFPLNLVTLELDKAKAEVNSSLLGLKPKTAIYRRGLGCTLLKGEDDFHIERHSFFQDKKQQPSTILPASSLARQRKDKLEEIKTLAMDARGIWDKKTTSLMIVYRDSLVAEFYANGFTSETEILGWSMTKSVCSLMAGAMVQDGLLNIHEDNLYPAWENDDRQNISLANLLKMNSGLSWQEEYASISDITQGLFMEEDIVSYARNKQLDNKIGQEWKYASGTTNLISGLMRRKFEAYQDYLNYPQQRLFQPLGIQHATIETDEAGNYIMSSYMFAKTRDWAKLGLLCLHQGQWNGTALIDSSYMEWALSSSTADPNYGAQFWLNTNQKDYPSAPEDAYKFSGYNGQYVIIIPSKELVIVRTGLSKGPPFDMDKVIGAVIDLISG